MKGQTEALRTDLADAGPHIPEYDVNGKVLMLRNLECHHCDVICKHLMLRLEDDRRRRARRRARWNR